MPATREKGRLTLLVIFLLAGLGPAGLRAQVDPTIGAPEEFNASTYVNIYPDLMNVYGSNLSAATTHWKNWGLPAGRRATAVFDPQYYLAHNSDIQQACGQTGYVCAMQHFMNQ